MLLSIMTNLRSPGAAGVQAQAAGEGVRDDSAQQGLQPDVMLAF